VLGIQGTVGQHLRQTLAQELEQQLVQQRMAEQIRQFDEGQKLQRERLDLERGDMTARRDAEGRQQRSLDNRTGVEEMRLTRAAMDKQEQAAQVDALANDATVPAPVRSLIPLLRAGAIQNIPADALRPPMDPLKEYEDKKKIDRKYAAPSATTPHYQTLVSPDGKQQRVPDGAEVNRLMGQGWKLYDAAAERQSTMNQPNTAKAEEVKTRIRDIATQLKAHPGRSGMTGNRVLNPAYGLGLKSEPVSGTPEAGAKALFDSLRSVMTLENLGLLKGVLSDRDMQVLQSAATTLQTTMPDPDFVKELDTILEKVGGAVAVPGNDQSRTTETPYQRYLRLRGVR
jgi:hypothetical protein